MAKALLLLAVLAGGYWVYTHPNVVDVSPSLGLLPGKTAQLQKQAQELSRHTEKAVIEGADKAKEYAQTAKEEITQKGQGVVKGAQVGIYDQAVAAAEKALSSVAKSLGLEDKETTQLGTTPKTTNIVVDGAPQQTEEEVVRVCSISAPGKQIEFGLQLKSASQNPYAITVEWGDETKTSGGELTGQKIQTVGHTYKNAGTYTITIRAVSAGKEYVSYKTLCVN